MRAVVCVGGGVFVCGGGGGRGGKGVRRGGWFFLTIFNTSLLKKRYVHAELEDTQDWYIQHCISHINME